MVTGDFTISAPDGEDPERGWHQHRGEQVVVGLPAERGDHAAGNT